MAALWHRQLRRLCCIAATAAEELPPARERVITYGKYKGEQMGALPDQYLRSMLKKPLWAQSARQIVDERAAVPGVPRPPLVFTIGKRSPIRSEIVSFDYGSPPSELNAEDEVFKEDELEVQQVQQVDEEEEVVREGRGRRRRSKQEMLRRIQAEELENLVSSDDSSWDREGSEEEDSSDEEVDVAAVGKQYRDSRRREICDELQRMNESNRPFSLVQMERLIDEVEQEKMKLGSNAYAYLVFWCGRLGDLALGERLHTHMMKTGQSMDKQMRRFLMEMYAGCGDMDTAGEFFEKMKEKDEQAWAVMITGYEETGEGIEALRMFAQMDLEGYKLPNMKAIESCVRACTILGDAVRGKEVHDSIHARTAADSIVGTALVEMYAAADRIDEARAVFNGIRRKDSPCYATMMTALPPEEVIALFRKMDLDGVVASEDVLSRVLSACERLRLSNLRAQLRRRLAALGVKPGGHVRPRTNELVR